MQFFTLGSSKIEGFETYVFDTVITLNDHPRYVKNVLGRIYVFFTLFEYWTRGGGGGHMVDGRDNAWRNRAPGPHAHRTTARQAMDGLWTEACGQQKQSKDPGNN